MSLDNFDLFKPLADRFTSLYPDQEWGIGHVVVSDYNFYNEALDLVMSLEDKTDGQYVHNFIRALKLLNEILELDSLGDEDA